MPPVPPLPPTSVLPEELDEEVADADDELPFLFGGFSEEQ